MCGIAGMVFRDPTRRVPPEVMRAPLAAIVHRGPDGEGVLAEPGIVAGMRRLAIIDLAGGDQPIWNEDHSVAVIYNGELYNHRELRAELEAGGHTFRTHSDTEVLVHLYEDFGERMLERLDGMFGFVLWDARRSRALLARDRFGIKPLHLRETPAGIAFASEIKSLRAMGITEAKFDPRWVGDYLRYTWIPEPHTAWEGVTRLAPGTFVQVDRGTIRAPERYFRPSVRVQEREAAPDVAQLVRNAVRRQLVADVPVGAFLSGGLDSSLITLTALALGAQVPTHTIRIREEQTVLDEGAEDARYAERLARSAGLDHHVHEVNANVVEMLPKIVSFTDDPHADPAMLHTYLICQAARSDSKVLLSGMGADEIGGGYRRDVAANYLRALYRSPRSLRHKMFRTFDLLGKTIDRTSVRGRLARRLVKALRGVPEEARELGPRYAHWVPESWLLRLGLEASPTSDIVATMMDRIDADYDDPLEATMAFDVGLYLPSHNLRYVDLMSMAASVEVRVPFLDNELARTLTGLPHEDRVRGREGKVALRRAARSIVPDEILSRPKVGFGAPIRDWLRGPLAPLLRDVLSESNVRRRGWLPAEGVSALLGAHERNEGDLAYALWGLLTLELWADAHLRASPLPSERCFSE